MNPATPPSASISTGSGLAARPSRMAGHALVEALVAQGVDTCFGVPGESYLAVLDGFHEHRDGKRAVPPSWPRPRAS